MGEGGYFFANLCCAVSFIENMTAESIGMDPEEFDCYITGRAVPPGSWRSSMLTCEGLQVMSQNVKTLMEVKNRYTDMTSTTLGLRFPNSSNPPSPFLIFFIKKFYPNLFGYRDP